MMTDEERENFVKELQSLKNHKNKETSFWKVFLGIIFVVSGFLGLLLYTIWAYATVGMSLWEWFMIPLGMKPITLAHAWGLSLLCHLWTYHHNPFKGTDERGEWAKTWEIVKLLIFPWTVYLMGSIAKSFL